MLAAPLTLGVLAAAQAAVFAPPPGVPFAVVTERVHGEGPLSVRYRIERRVTFARDGIGWRAEVLLVAADADATAAMETMFEAGYAGLAGRTMVFRLDGAGKVVSIDDRAALWEAFCRGMAALVVKRGDRPRAWLEALAEQVVAPLRALPAERQHAMLASLIGPLIAEEAGEAPGSVRAVRIPGASPFGGPAALEGTRSIAAAGALLRSTTRAAAEVVRAGEAPGRVEAEIVRDVDPRTGLLVAGTEVMRTRVGEGASAQSIERITTVRVAPAASAPPAD